MGDGPVIISQIDVYLLQTLHILVIDELLVNEPLVEDELGPGSLLEELAGVPDGAVLLELGLVFAEDDCWGPDGVTVLDVGPGLEVDELSGIGIEVDELSGMGIEVDELCGPGIDVDELCGIVFEFVSLIAELGVLVNELGVDDAEELLLGTEFD